MVTFMGLVMKVMEEHSVLFTSLWKLPLMIIITSIKKNIKK